MSSPDAVHFSIENFNEDFNMLTIIPCSNILELNFVHPEGHKTTCFEWIGRSWIFTLCEKKSVRLMWNNPWTPWCNPSSSNSHPHIATSYRSITAFHFVTPQCSTSQFLCSTGGVQCGNTIKLGRSIWTGPKRPWVIIHYSRCHPCAFQRRPVSVRIWLQN